MTNPHDSQERSLRSILNPRLGPRGVVVALLAMAALAVGTVKGCEYLADADIRTLEKEPILRGVPGWRLISETKDSPSGLGGGAAQASITQDWSAPVSQQQAEQALLRTYTPIYGKLIYQEHGPINTELTWRARTPAAQVGVSISGTGTTSTIGIVVRELS